MQIMGQIVADGWLRLFEFLAAYKDIINLQGPTDGDGWHNSGQ